MGWVKVAQRWLRIHLPNAGDSGSIHGSGRCPGEGAVYSVFLPRRSHGHKILAG